MPHVSVRVIALTVTVGSFLAATSAQQPPDPNFVREQIFDSYLDFRTELDRVGNIPDAAQRDTEVELLWQRLTAAGQVPYAQGNQVAFLFRGNGSIAFPGDANGWNPNAGGWQATPVGQSGIQIVERQLPSDARVDYKVFRNGAWILDPSNPLQMWSGFGPNSELRMPDYEYPHETIVDSQVDRGSLSANQLISSSHLGYDAHYRVYTPANYESLDGPVPVVYFTDGHEYSASHMGSATEVMDNLIAEGKLQPTVAVFIDPRDPVTGRNRRADEYITNREFARFVADELVPAVEASYEVAEDAAERTIIGTSLGGLNSAYFGAVENDTFRNLGIHSPAFWPAPALYTSYADGALSDEVKIFMSTGTINDEGGATSFANLLQTGGYDYRFTTVNEGHSWGSWRSNLDDMLVHLVGPAVPEPHLPGVFGGGLLAWVCLRRRRR